MTAELAREVAARVGRLDGVVAVALGGSLARGRGDDRSDVDLGIYYDPARPFSIEALRALVTELDDRHAPELVGFGGWGPWINGGAWTRMRGTKLDLLYRDLRLVDRVLDDCAAGRVTCDYQPGHPHGFHNHSYAGEVHHGLALHDPDGALAERQARTSTYPPALAEAIVRRHLWEARFAVTTAAGAAGRGDLTYVSGCLFRSVACLVQVLFAVNGRWFVNEKGSVAEAAGLPRTPPGFAADVAAALSGLQPDPATLTAALERMRVLTHRVGEVV
ncbi:MAG TPA: nucleotidyltransferase domain-containing protein [Actinomycetes bacterium]|nr:nucleotidyltransferase domain-containing protein [Actinomycetes bacterium]